MKSKNIEVYTFINIFIILPLIYMYNLIITFRGIISNYILTYNGKTLVFT